MVDSEKISDNTKDDDDVLLSQWIQTVDGCEMFLSYEMDEFVAVDDG